MKSQKKELIIVIPGAKYIRSSLPFIQKTILFFYHLTNTRDPVYSNYALTWKNKLYKKNRQVTWLHWGRGISAISTWFAVRKLKKIINKYKNTHTISIVGISLGGEIALETLKFFPDSTFDKIILLASINGHAKIKNNTVRIFNLYSLNDTFAKISTKVWAPVHGSMILNGKNVTNVEIDGMSHDQFCSDALIREGRFTGKSIFEVVNSYLYKKS